jgi:hypothetical protein
MSELSEQDKKAIDSEYYRYTIKRLLEVYNDYLQECRQTEDLIEKLEELLDKIDYEDITDNVNFRETEHWRYIACWHDNRICAVKVEKEDTDPIKLTNFYEHNFIYMKQMATDTLLDFVEYLPRFLDYMASDIMLNTDKLRIAERKIEYMLLNQDEGT